MSTDWLPKGSRKGSPAAGNGTPRTSNCADLVLSNRKNKKQKQEEGREGGRKERERERKEKREGGRKEGRKKERKRGGSSMTFWDSRFINGMFPFIKLS